MVGRRDADLNWIAHAPFFVVVWVAVPELRALETSRDIGAEQILQSLEEFRPEEWGIPPYES